MTTRQLESIIICATAIFSMTPLEAHATPPPRKASSPHSQVRKPINQYQQMIPQTDTSAPSDSFIPPSQRGNVSDRWVSPAEKLGANADKMFPEQGKLQGVEHQDYLRGNASKTPVRDYAYFTTEADGKVHRIKTTYLRYENPGWGDTEEYKERHGQEFTGVFHIPVVEVNANSQPFVEMTGRYVRDASGRAYITDLTYMYAQPVSNGTQYGNKYFGEPKVGADRMPRKIWLHTTDGEVPNLTQYND